jgi:hypothetical protein
LVNCAQPEKKLVDMTGIAAQRVEPELDRIPHPLGGRYPPVIARLSELHLRRAGSALRLIWVFPQHRYWISLLRALQNLNRQEPPQQLEIAVMTPAPDSLVKVKSTPRERDSVKDNERVNERDSVKVSGLGTGIAAQDPIIANPAEMGIVIEALAATARGRTAGIAASDRITAIQPVR